MEHESYEDPFAGMKYDPILSKISTSAAGFLNQLREFYPNGHPRFYELMNDMMDLHNRKNREYAHGGPPLGNFTRVSYLKQPYKGIDWTSPEGTCLDYMLKQFDAVLNGMATSLDFRIESVEDRVRDIVVYWVIFLCIMGDKNDSTCKPSTK